MHASQVRTRCRVVQAHEAWERDCIDEGPAGGGHGALHVCLGHTEELRNVLQRDLEGRKVHAATFHVLSLHARPTTLGDVNPAASVCVEEAGALCGDQACGEHADSNQVPEEYRQTSQ